MNDIRINTIFGALCLLLAGGCFHSCQEDEDYASAEMPSRESLIESGRYLAAGNAEAAAALTDPDKSAWFEENTPYRLVAFVKPYSKDTSGDETPAGYPRFNKVAWEGAVGQLRFINVADRPDYWFGFSAIGSETGGSDGRVSIDFYGFTYGQPADRTVSYIQLDGLSGETVPQNGTLAALKRTESVVNGKLNDLMRGRLLNQNILTAGEGSSQTQSILPFRHCFSLLHFKVAQQPAEGTENEPSFPDVYVEDIKVTGTYSEGAVYLQSGKVELKEEHKCTRQLIMKPDYKDPVTTKEVNVGDMILFPSDGESSLTSGKSYTLGLEITLKGPDKDVMQKFLVNSGGTGEPVPGADGYYRVTISRAQITDGRTVDKPLYLKQNTEYILVISLQDDAVRIITVIPQVAEWIQGEGTDKDPWFDIPMGQPQMFDNVLWGDRNLGADDYDPINGVFEKTVGYFYQSGRNIPYYPFNPDLSGSVPDFTTKNDQHLPNHDTSWSNSPYRFFPIVDSKIRRMSGDYYWCIKNDKQPQMSIPETMPEDRYFDFLVGTNEFNTGLEAEDDMHWEGGQQNQPVTGSWVLPSSNDFLTIFPSTPHAGNITMRTGSTDSHPMKWGDNPGRIDLKKTKTLRITVPYYKNGMETPARDDANYIKAWNILKTYDKDENGDPVGTTHIDDNVYTTGGPNDSNMLNLEPNGDPEDGYASVYVISMNEEDGSKNGLAGTYEEGYEPKITEWGTIYAIKRVYTPQAYRMRWRVLVAKEGTHNPCLYVEVCRYRCTDTDLLTEENYATKYDWDHPAARIYFPICGLGDWNGKYINFGMECQYATRDPIVNGKTSALQIKITGDNTANCYMAVVKNVINRNFGKQIRPVGGGK